MKVSTYKAIGGPLDGLEVTDAGEDYLQYNAAIGPGAIWGRKLNKEGQKTKKRIILRYTHPKSVLIYLPLITKI